MSERKLKALVREEALEDFSSSELLDQTMVVVRGKGWLLIAILTTVIAASLVWGFLGEIPITVQGTGIIVEKAAPLVVENPTATGAVVAVRVKPGDVLTSGQVLVQIGDPEVETELRTAQADLALLKSNNTTATASEDDSLAKEHVSIDRQLAATFATLDRTRKLMVLYENQVADQEKLAEKKLIPLSQLISTRALLFQTQEDEKTQFSQLAQLESQLAQMEQTITVQRQQRMQAIKQAEIDVEKMTTRAEVAHFIKVPIRARVIDVHVGRGSVVSPGDAVATVLPVEDSNLDGGASTPVIAITFIEYGKGKQVEPGMLARIGVPFAPTTEYGFIKGSVGDVSDFASDETSVARLVGSKVLAKEIISAAAVPLEVVVDLDQDTKSMSGLAWTSGEGFPGPIPSLTECTVQITTRMEKPIDLVIPWLKKKLGIDVEPAPAPTS